MSKQVKKIKPLKEEIQHNVRIRDYAQKKLDSDVKKCESNIKKIEDSIQNHEKEMQDKKDSLKELKKQLEEFNFIKSNLPLVTV